MDSTRIPPHTPGAIAKPLKRLLHSCDALADAGVQVAISLCYVDAADELTGILIADRRTVELAASVMSPGVLVMEAGRQAEA